MHDDLASFRVTKAFKINSLQTFESSGNYDTDRQEIISAVQSGTVPGNRAVSQVASEETPELELTRSQNRFGRFHRGRAGGAWGREGLYLRRMGNCGLPPTQETKAVFKYCNSRM